MGETVNIRLPDFIARIITPGPRTITLEKRRVKRENLSIPVKAIVDTRELANARAMNFSPLGLYIQVSPAPPRGNTIDLSFEHLNKEETPVQIKGRVVWNSRVPHEGMGIEIDRKATSPEALKDYRSLVLHYIRHPGSY